MASSQYEFINEEPQALQDLNLDYLNIEFSQASLSVVQVQSKEATILFECQVSVIEQYIIFKKNTILETGNQELQWLNINQWLVKFVEINPLLDNQQLTIKLQQDDLTDSYIEVLLQNEMDYVSLKPLFYNVCIIAAPSIDIDFAKKRKLGQGAQASVFLYQSLNEDNPEKFAVKVYRIRSRQTLRTMAQEIRSEINFLRELKICENVSQLDRVYYDGHHICMVMKFAQHGTLMKYVEDQKKFTEEQIRIIMEQLVLALDLMHRKQIIHRDIKPDNILLENKENLKICISDLGLACRSTDEQQVKLKCGTPGYVGPEILKGNYPFTPKSDIFGVGCLFYKLVTGKNLFQGKDMKDLLLSNKFQNPFSIITLNVNGVTNECKDLLQWMVQTNPEARPTAEQCINHKWFSKDRVALQNSLMINKNSHILATLFYKPLEVTQQDFSSFQIAPNYFEHMYSNSQASNTPKGSLSPQSSQGMRSPNAAALRQNSDRIKFCYNHIISQGRVSAESKALKEGTDEEDKQNDFSKFYNISNRINQQSSHQIAQQQIQIPAPDIRKVTGNDPDSFDEADFNDKLQTEYTPRIFINDINTKCMNRVFISNVYTGERTMHHKNKDIVIAKNRRRIFQ